MKIITCITCKTLQVAPFQALGLQVMVQVMVQVMRVMKKWRRAGKSPASPATLSKAKWFQGFSLQVMGSASPATEELPA